MWREHYGIYYSEKDARNQVEEWKQERGNIKKYKNPKTIRIR